ncbi:MAG: T9SS type A sorting domain-containing protein [Lewinellaceae bacterium]|nr:T9SS type A sorting domain-containing protein [Lewinellaceae bacterium]
MNRSFYSVRSFSVMAILFCSLFASGQCGLDDYIAYFNFDGNANDAGSDGWHVTLHGNPWFSYGKFGQAINFDGEDDYGTIDGGFNLSNDFTVMAFVNIDSIYDPPRENAAFQAIFAKAEALSGPNPFWFGLEGERVSYIIGDCGGGSESCFESNPILSSDSIFHIAWVRDQSRGLIYVNCEEVASKDDIPDIIQNEDVVSIGGRIAREDGIFRNRFEGWIDDLRVYDRALSPEELCCLVPANYIYPGNDEIQLFPNPNSGTFTLQFEEETTTPLSVCIFNTLGEQVHCQRLEKGTSSLDFGLSEQSKGIYLLRVQDETGTYLKTLKFLIQ